MKVHPWNDIWGCACCFLPIPFDQHHKFQPPGWQQKKIFWTDSGEMADLGNGAGVMVATDLNCSKHTVSLALLSCIFCVFFRVARTLNESWFLWREEWDSWGIFSSLICTICYPLYCTPMTHTHLSIFSVYLYCPSCCHIKHTLQTYIWAMGEVSEDCGTQSLFILPRTTSQLKWIKNMAPELPMIAFKLLSKWQK